MNIRKLTVFYKTATYLNMTKVAKELYISQPSVSQTIHEMEEELGVTLFDRIGKKLYLTNEGEIFLNYVRRIINLYEEGIEKVHEIAEMESGKIRIGASTTIGIYILPEIIRNFIAKHKDIEISLIIENTSNIEKLILENKVDLAFVEGKIYSEEIKEENIWEDELVFICSDMHKWKNRDFVCGKELIKEKLIMREIGSGTREVIESYLNEKNIDYKIFMELGNSEAIKNSVEANLGIGCISIKCIEEKIKQKKLCMVRLEEGTIKRNLKLIMHKDKFINNNLKEFIKLAYK